MDETENKLPENASENADKSVTLKLFEPIEVADETIEALTFYPLKAGHLIDAENAKTAGERTRFLIQSSLKKKDMKGRKLVDEMGISDFVDVQQVLSFFMKNGRKISAAS